MPMGAVVDHSLLAPQLAHLLRQHARLQVDPGAGGLRHDDADGAVGIIVRRLRRGGDDEQRRARQRGKQRAFSHARSSPMFLLPAQSWAAKDRVSVPAPLNAA
jgi:hypothetical protein